MLGKAIGEDRTTRECSNYEKLKFAIDELLCNSHGFGVVSNEFVQTDPEEDDWRWKQEESHDLVKNWKSYAQSCS